MINQVLALMIFPLAVNLNLPTKLANSTPAEKVLAVRQMSLDQRYSVPAVNEVMKKNILLNIAYLSGEVSNKSQIDWEALIQADSYQFTLEPGEVFAYHDLVRPEYAGKLAVTTSTNFGAGDGYLSDGYLYGDGVCHLASLINWAARDAGLEVVVPKDHRSVSTINQIPDDYGVSIYKDPSANIGANNNLYITNNKDHAVSFSLNYNDGELEVKVSQV